MGEAITLTLTLRGCSIASNRRCRSYCDMLFNVVFDSRSAAVNATVNTTVNAIFVMRPAMYLCSRIDSRSAKCSTDYLIR